jgi:hypothetical protein
VKESSWAATYPILAVVTWQMKEHSQYIYIVIVDSVSKE